MPSFTVTYDDTVTPRARTHMQPQPVSLHYEAKDVELSASDASHIKQLGEAFEKAMKAHIKSQLSGLDERLGQMDAKLVKLKSELADKKNRFYGDLGRLPACAAQLEVLKTKQGEIDRLAADYDEMIKDWATGFGQQHGKLAWAEAVRNARITVINEKKVRVLGGLVGRTVLKLVGIGLSGASLSHVKSAYDALDSVGRLLKSCDGFDDLAKQIRTSYDVEAKLVANLGKDIEELRAAAVAISNPHSRIVKHAGELQNLIHAKRDQRKKLEAAAEKYQAALHSYTKGLEGLLVDEARDYVEQGPLQARKKEIDEARNSLQQLRTQCATIDKDLAVLNQLMLDVNQVGVDLSKVTPDAPRTILDHLTQNASGLKGWLALAAYAESLTKGIKKLSE